MQKYDQYALKTRRDRNYMCITNLGRNQQNIHVEQTRYGLVCKDSGYHIVLFRILPVFKEYNRTIPEYTTLIVMYSGRKTHRCQPLRSGAPLQAWLSRLPFLLIGHNFIQKVDKIGGFVLSDSPRVDHSFFTLLHIYAYFLHDSISITCCMHSPFYIITYLTDKTLCSL